MKQRTITGALLVLFLVPILIVGNSYQIFNILVFIIILLASVEFRNILKKTKILPMYVDISIIILSIVSGVLFYLSLSLIILPIYYYLYLLLTVFLLSFFLVFVNHFDTTAFGNSLLTVFYTSLGFASLAFLRDLGLEYVIYILIITMITDTAAYLFGVKFGRHKIAPRISPKKSVEGSVAGLIFGAGFGSGFGIIYHLFDLNFFIIISISMFISIIAQIGDLVASKFKRDAGVKDYSNIFPGHGGILDRFDSAMFASLAFVMIHFLIEAI